MLAGEKQVIFGAVCKVTILFLLATKFHVLLFTEHFAYYLRQVMGVNGGDTVVVRCVCVCVSVRLCSVDLSIRPDWALNGNSSKTVKVTDFKFDAYVPRNSSDMNALLKKGRGQGHVTPKFLGVKC